LTPETGLGDAFRRMDVDGLEDVPVVDPAQPKRVIGMLSRADLIAAYNRTVAILSTLPMPAWLSTAEAEASERYRVIVLPAPARWIGRSLRELECRARYGVTVLAVQPSGRAAGASYEMPDPDRPLAPGDILVLAGTADGLRLAQAA
jgi:uncharacterized protein with PhoU and TrkA domain